MSMLFASLQKSEGLASKAFKILWFVSEISLFTQESLGINPDWLLFRSLMSCKNAKILSKINSAKRLEHMIVMRQDDSC